MKTYFSLFSALVFSMISHAAVFTLSNNPANPGQYNTFAAAHAAASNGDTILVHGSNFNYGNFTLSKRLTVIGTGHNPQKQAPLRSFVDYIDMSTGSNRSQIIGLEVYQLSVNNQHIDSVNVQFCKFNYRIIFASYYCNSWNIEGNVFAYTGENIHGSCYNGNHMVRNNIFNGQIVNFSNCGQGYSYCDHNIFLANGDMMTDVFGWYFTNNIFFRGNPHGYAEGSNAWNYNLSFGCNNNNFPNGVGNQVNVNPGFVNFATPDYFSYAYDYRIQNGAAADNAGNDGTDLGVAGGFGEFDNNGIPHIPYIYQFNITNTTISSGTPLNITFTSRIR